MKLTMHQINRDMLMQLNGINVENKINHEIKHNHKMHAAQAERPKIGSLQP